MWIRDAFCSRKHFHLSILISPSKDVLALTIILFGKRDNLGCIEKAVFFSHQHQLTIDFHLNMSGVKFCHLGDDQSAPQVRQTSRTSYLGYIIVGWEGLLER